MSDLRIFPQYLYGKPTGNYDVLDADSKVVMVFRRHRGERTDTVRKRAQLWIDQGASGIPGVAQPKRPLAR